MIYLHFAVFSLFSLFLNAASHDQIPLQDAEIGISSLIRDILIDNEVIGDVLSDFEPVIDLQISYPSSHETVSLGNDIPVSAVSSAPAIEFHPFNAPHVRRPMPRPRRSAPIHSHSLNLFSPFYSTEIDFDPYNSNVTYTLALTDPDAKSRDNPKWAEMCHWIVTNLTLIPPSTSTTPEHSPTTIHTLAAKELKSYQPPGPPPRTGKHRYVFVLLAGDRSTTAAIEAPEERRHWGFETKKGQRKGVAKWAKSQGLKVVGVNFFQAQNEEQ